MTATNQLVNEYINFIGNESKTRFNTKSNMLNSITKLNDNILCAPAYDLERFLIKTYFNKNPEKYSVNEKVHIGETLIHNTSFHPRWIQELMKPPYKRLHKHYPYETYSNKAVEILTEDVNRCITDLYTSGIIIKGTGFGIITNPKNKKSRGLYVIDEKIIKNTTNKEQLKQIFEKDKISFLALACFSEPPSFKKEFSINDLVEKTILKISRGKCTNDVFYRFNTYGVRLS